MGMQRGTIYSAVLHLAVALLLIFGLPHFLDDKLVADQVMVVEMVQIAEKTNPPPSPPREEPPKPAPPKPAPPKPAPPKPAEDKPPPPQARPIPPPPVPEPPQPQVAEPLPEPAPKPPAPKPPEVKPEVKKEPPPPKETATPPRQIAEAPPPKKPPPKRDDFINSILKDVTPTPRSQEKTEAKQTPRKDAAPQRPPAPPSLDQQVTISEIDAVKRQIQECWSIPAGARDASNLIVTIRAKFAPDGTVTSATIDDRSRMNDPFYRAAAESALRAVRNPRCQPLKLPPHKYDQWKDLRLDFNPKDLIG